MGKYNQQKIIDVFGYIIGIYFKVCVICEIMYNVVALATSKHIMKADTETGRLQTKLIMLLCRSLLKTIELRCVF